MGERDRGGGKRVQLHRAVSKLGWGSRRPAWSWIEAGEVEVDGRVVTAPLTWVDLDRQRITRRGEAPASEAVVLALHKPRGVVTTRRDERGRPTVYDCLGPGFPWVFPAGRLDADSEGLLILTNDSALAMQLTRPGAPDTEDVPCRAERTTDGRGARRITPGRRAGRWSYSARAGAARRWVTIAADRNSPD
jgi:23S rRNA pseudouridine2605 synthase